MRTRRARRLLCVLATLAALLAWAVVGAAPAGPGGETVSPPPRIGGDVRGLGPAAAALGPEEAQEIGWGVQRIGAVGVQATGAGVTVAIIGSGCDLDHPDLVTNILGDVNYVERKQPAEDTDGLGTHSAGIVAAADNEVGFVGVAPDAGLLIVRALDETGGRSKNVAAGIDWARENGADVILLNFVGGGGSNFIRDALGRASDAGIVLVAGTEDALSPAVGEPGSRPQVIAASPTDSNDSFGFLPWAEPLVGSLDLAAPGWNVPTTDLNGGYAYLYTSPVFAAAHVGGTAALVIQQLATLGFDPSTCGPLFSDLVRLIMTDRAEVLLLGRPYPQGHQGDGLVRADLATALTTDNVNAYISALNDRHDIAIMNISAPSQVAPGEAVAAIVTVKNRATTGGNRTAKVLLSQVCPSRYPDSPVWTTYYSQEQLITLSPSASGDVTINLTAPSDVESYILYAEAKSYVDEAATMEAVDVDGTNNAMTHDVAVVAAPECGNGSCETGEDSCTCADDCGAPPLTEDNCTDGVDNDCDGKIDGADPDCPSCLLKGESCTDDSQCCSGDCNPGKKTCK